MSTNKQSNYLGNESSEPRFGHNHRHDSRHSSYIDPMLGVITHIRLGNLSGIKSVISLGINDSAIMVIIVSTNISLLL